MARLFKFLGLQARTTSSSLRFLLMWCCEVLSFCRLVSLHALHPLVDVSWCPVARNVGLSVGGEVQGRLSGGGRRWWAKRQRKGNLCSDCPCLPVGCLSGSESSFSPPHPPLTPSLCLWAMLQYPCPLVAVVHISCHSLMLTS